MSMFLRWLRGLGPIGGFIATAITVVTVNWALVVSAGIGLLAATWAALTSFFQNTGVEVGIAVFLASIWSYIGLISLYDRRRPTLTSSAPDYRHGLIFEGLLPNFVVTPNEPAALQFGLQFRNFSSGPMQYNVENFDIRVGSRSSPRLKRGELTSYLPRGAGRISNTMPFRLTR
jgi:hypothetical protein